MSKKRIIIMAAAGLISLGGTFVFTWQMQSRKSKSPEAKEPIVVSTTEAGEETEWRQPSPEAGIKSGAGESMMTNAAREKELKRLIYEMREKMQEYNNKLQDLEVQEERLEVAHDLIKKDIEKLNNLRVELASTVANIKSERDKLLKSRVEVGQKEKQNLISIAATYDKMDASSAAKILTNMCAGPAGGEESGSSIDDAVKILHYMTERTKGKLLAELVGSEPKLAAVLCRRLKQITEEEQPQT